MTLTSVLGPQPQSKSGPSAIMVTGPAGEPVTLADAKAWLKLDTSDEDALLTSLITAARLSIEAASRRMLMSQTWRFVFDLWPADGIARINLGPVQSLVAIRSYDASGVATLYDLGGFQLDRSSEPVRIVPMTQTQPITSRKIAGIEVDLLLGFGPTPGDIPQPLRQAILLLVAHLFEGRGDGAGEALPPDVETLVAPYRRRRI